MFIKKVSSILIILHSFVSMDVDETVISKPVVVPPMSPPKFRSDEVRLRNSGSKQSPSHRVRPVSAFIPSSVSPDSKG